MKNIVLYAALALMPLLSACNTMEGLGKDVQRGGEKLEDSANKVKNNE